MIAIIRISGRTGLKKPIEETLNRLRIRKKFSCVVIPENKVNLGMIKKVNELVAYGTIDKKTFVKLIEKRGQAVDKKKKINAEEIVKGFEDGKSYKELNLKPYFRLHPARGGMKTKYNVSEGGVLGNHKEKINELIERML